MVTSLINHSRVAIYVGLGDFRATATEAMNSVASSELITIGKFEEVPNTPETSADEVCCSDIRVPFFETAADRCERLGQFHCNGRYAGRLGDIGRHSMIIVCSS